MQRILGEGQRLDLQHSSAKGGAQSFSHLVRDVGGCQDDQFRWIPSLCRQLLLYTVKRLTDWTVEELGWGRLVGWLVDGQHLSKPKQTTVGKDGNGYQTMRYLGRVPCLHTQQQTQTQQGTHNGNERRTVPLMNTASFVHPVDDLPWLEASQRRPVEEERQEQRS